MLLDRFGKTKLAEKPNIPTTEFSQAAQPSYRKSANALIALSSSSSIDSSRGLIVVTDIELTQHPVGQGGMMSGWLEFSDPSSRSFHWIYDCGSNQTTELNREIDKVVARGQVDFLFLSHLDSDHISGIDRLLSSKVRVYEVVLPYLNDLDRLIAVAHDAATGALAGTFLTFLSDIEGWFRNRGVERITYITPRDDDDEGGEGPDLPPVGEDRASGTIEPRWSRRPIEMIDGIGRRLESGASLRLATRSGFVNWILAPYAHRPSDKDLATFRAKIQSQFNEDVGTPGFLSATLRDPKMRDLLRSCYDLIWSDHNLVSMALYSGPRNSERWKSSESNFFPYLWPDPSGPIGWLGTGDMHLNVPRRWKAFHSHYSPLLDKVNVFCLPHHGSDRNFHMSLPDAMSHVMHFVAAAGPNGYGHPGKLVKRKIKASGKQLVVVSNKVGSALVWNHRSL